MLTLVGLGLCDGTDITLRGKQAVERATSVYIESYTSLLQCSHEELEAQLSRKVTKLARQDVEIGIGRILEEARAEDVVILVIGDVFGATTHTDLYLRAREIGVQVSVVHNASIMNAIGAAGLELYRFGKTVSIPYWLPGFEPASFLDGIKENRERGLHTLCLLDIKADEGRFMSVAEGIAHLRKAEAARGYGVVSDETLVIGVARIGCPDQQIIAGTAAEVGKAEFGRPPHALIIPGRLHHIEEEMLKLWK
jgi:diphthine synthase